MATIDSKEMIDEIIAANGKLYDDEDPVVKIVEYTNMGGVRTWGVVFEGENLDRYHASPFVVNPKTIFERKEEE